ncbi:MAG: 16S rRNA (adenine(1518)-N(6)/adenine(1519)-N(6))-dimethyltransferase RsmA [Patescibacteria group bacterium]
MPRAKKSLGQHFLTDTAARRAIIEAGQLTAQDIVLEVGPGSGFLTAALLETGARVIAVEKDDRLIAPLTARFQNEISEKKLELIHADILDFLEAKSYKLKADYKLIANIPYYITGQLLRKFLSSEHQPLLAVLMLQKEVARRIVAVDGKESILSISVKAYGKPRYVRTVPAGAFSPQPKVDSAIMAIENISKNNFIGLGEQKFFRLLRQGFSSKRKIFKNNLKLPAEVLVHCQIDPHARAENLTLKHWTCLARPR